MTPIIESDRLIEMVIDKHNKFLESFSSEFSGLESKLNEVKQQADIVKKELEATEARIAVLNEKYFLLFHQAKKQREEITGQVIEKMRAAKFAMVQDMVRLSSRIDEFEKRLGSSKKYRG